MLTCFKFKCKGQIAPDLKYICQLMVVANIVVTLMMPTEASKYFNLLFLVFSDRYNLYNHIYCSS